MHSLDKENSDGMGLLSLDDTPLGAPDGRVAALGAQDGSSASLDAALRAQVRCLTASHRLRVCRFAVLRVIHRDLAVQNFLSASRCGAPPSPATSGTSVGGHDAHVRACVRAQSCAFNHAFCLSVPFTSTSSFVMTPVYFAALRA